MVKDNEIKVMLLKAFMESMHPKPKEVNIKESKISRFYNECLLLKNGNIVDLAGSHMQTAGKFFKVDLENDIAVEEYGPSYFTKRFGVIFIHSFSKISAGRLSNQQKQTINIMVEKNYIDKKFKTIKRIIKGKGV